jgi:L-seryl-tRNA(Ser) seleniumtransferase
MPGVTLPSCAVAVSYDGLSPDQAYERLRNAEIPIVATVRDDNVVLDMRAVGQKDIGYIAESLRRIIP